jgi:hypothetical protein
LLNKPFWIWNQHQHKLQDIKTNGNCCFNHTQNNDSVLYENSQYGYSIQYPSDWIIHESTITPAIERAPTVFLPSVDITSPDKVATLWVVVKNAAQFLDTNDMKIKTKTAHNYVKDEINIFATNPSLYSNVRIVKDKLYCWLITHKDGNCTTLMFHLVCKSIT